MATDRKAVFIPALPQGHRRDAEASVESLHLTSSASKDKAVELRSVFISNRASNDQRPASSDCDRGLPGIVAPLSAMDNAAIQSWSS